MKSLNNYINESEYNLDLVKKALNIDENLTFYPKIFVDDKEKEFAENFLKEHNIFKGEKFLIFHPGSSGSSLDLPLEKYFTIMNIIAKKGKKFLITEKQKTLFIHNFYF